MITTARNPRAGAAEFRRAFRCVPGPVAVVLTHTGEDHVQGITCTSAGSLSASPPLAMFSVDVKTGFADVVSHGGLFAINYLASDRAEWASAFSRGGQSLEDLVRMVGTGRTGAPVLRSGTTAVLECRQESRYDAGDHVIVIGAVLHTRADVTTPPLIYHSGRYGSFQSPAERPSRSNSPRGSQSEEEVAR
jgi:flavin reductase (DIM6/NTAB) family NADH-FMN oxidoreductase RutF